jgi:hypothetical protein
MSGYIQDPLDIDVYYSNEEKLVGYSVGKWSDDDDHLPITPFFGTNR